MPHRDDLRKSRDQMQKISVLGAWSYGNDLFKIYVYAWNNVSQSVCFRLQRNMQMLFAYASSADHHISETLGKQQPLKYIDWTTDDKNRSHLARFSRSDLICVP